MLSNYQTKIIHRSLHVVNRHLKTAIDKNELYVLKKSIIEKLLKEGKAYKIGIHRGSVVVKCGDYQFHQKASNEDLKTPEFHFMGVLNFLSDFYKGTKKR